MDITTYVSINYTYRFSLQHKVGKEAPSWHMDTDDKVHIYIIVKLRNFNFYHSSNNGAGSSSRLTISPV
jgi:hypothetical protein